MNRCECDEDDQFLTLRCDETPVVNLYGCESLRNVMKYFQCNPFEKRIKHIILNYKIAFLLRTLFLFHSTNTAEYKNRNR